ncbi:MAG: Gfo/Idh/MocA family oxidoreductase [Oscillospiraceae bacterium]|jgi:predicted dehydrogenase|nr:Gfo/Idh/MocA family oxidoreductase [Oscillospiraceae bacterium]
MDKVRLAFIGCGGICKGFHARNLKDFEDVEVVAVADPVEERREQIAAMFGTKRLYKNHTELYDREDKSTVDAVYIMVEPTAHTDTELRAIDLGLPFMVEKPMTLDIGLAERIVKGVAEKNLITSCGFQDRYLDVMNLVKEELPRHKPGGLVYGAWVGGVPGVWWWQKRSTCGGQLYEQTIHILDGLRYLFGEAIDVYATASRGIVDADTAHSGVSYDTDDHSTAVIRFPNAVTATLVSGCYLTDASGGAFSGIRVTLSDMTIEYRLRDRVTFTTKRETREVRKSPIEHGIAADRAFINAIKSGDGSGIKSPYSDGIKSLRLGLAANESMETGKVVRL